MKRQLLWAIILPLLVLSCTTSLGFVYDEAVPFEKSAWLSNASLGTITGYNGITVNWKQEMGAKMIQIPAGETLLEVDLNSLGTTGKGLLFQFDFQAGKQYCFIAGRDKETDDAGLRVYAWNMGEKLTTYSDKNLVAFVPFLNVAGNTGTGVTVLE
jgi:hypothetical protein